MQIIHKYGLLGSAKLFFNLIRTRCFFHKARLIRFPFEIRGKSHICFGSNLTLGVGCRFEANHFNRRNKTLVLGNNIQMNDYVHITANQSVKIGNNVLIASKVYISDTVHGSYLGDGNDSNPNEPPVNRKLFFKQITIEDNVWIGEFVSILPGVQIGKGSIIGANSTVTKDIPEYSIAVGSPAKIIKRFNLNTNKWEKTK